MATCEGKIKTVFLRAGDSEKFANANSYQLRYYLRVLHLLDAVECFECL